MTTHAFLLTTLLHISRHTTGFWMVYLLDIPLTTPWIAASLFLFLFAGACWLPVVWLQIRMQKIAEEAVANESALPARYWQMARWWFRLGVPAFTSMVLVVTLMVFKHIPGAGS